MRSSWELLLCCGHQQAPPAAVQSGGHAGKHEQALKQCKDWAPWLVRCAACDEPV